MAKIHYNSLTIIEKYDITTLNTKKALETEGRVMRHSAAKYWPRVERGSNVIISVRDLESNTRIATGKLDKTPRGWTLALLVGPMNHKVDKAVKRAAASFVNEYNSVQGSTVG